jgi:sialate O-acetylesterase
MDGCGKLVNLEPPSRMVHAFHYDETWGIARAPICWVHESIDPVHWNTDDPEKREEFNRQNRAFRTIGAGLGVRFGKDMYKATGVPVGLLVCSHGGTSMDQWNPELKSQGGKSLYGSMMRRVGVAGGKVAGCLWYQGESDALGPDAGESYKEKTRRLIESIRADLKQPDMPFIHVQLAPFYSGEMKLIEGWNRVQTAQLALESEMRNVAVVPAIDCTLSDSIHVDAASLRRLGARMALLARKLWFGAKDIPYGPRLAGCSFADKERTKLRVKFTGANGVLRPVSRIVGFSVLVKDEPREIKSCMRDGGDGTSVALTLAEPVPKGAVLWYGRGLNPACNLSDSAGFPVPVFGPVRLA